MKIWLVRHGETRKNKEKLLQGRSDAPLNENGIMQAEKVRDFFTENGIVFHSVYSSPLLRAVQTAEIIAGSYAKIHKDALLLEMDYGPYEGSSLENPAPEIVRFFSDFVHNPAPEGMESLEHVTARMRCFLERIKRINGTHTQNVLVTTHAIAMKGALEYLTPKSKGSYWSKYIGTCSVYMTEFDGRRYGIPEEVFSISFEPGV